MEKMRIVFMGTPEFAVSTLDKLIKNHYNVVGVITAPDKPAGRGRKLNESAVKKFALANDLNLLQPTNLKDDDFLNELEALNANLQIVVAFRMLPKVVWDMPKYGTFNLHASLLPDYRGAAPIHWAIINGETKSGVTTFFIDEKIDTGAIIAQIEVNITDDETVGTLHDKLMEVGSNLVIDTVRLIEGGNIETKIQPKTSKYKTAYKFHKDNTRIDWSLDVDTIYNKVRGLNPFPAAWSEFLNKGETINVKIYDVEKNYDSFRTEIGSVSSDGHTINVSVRNGNIIIKEIQLPGKRKMDTKSLLNGYEIESDAKML